MYKTDSAIEKRERQKEYIEDVLFLSLLLAFEKKVIVSDCLVKNACYCAKYIK